MEPFLNAIRHWPKISLAGQIATEVGAEKRSKTQGSEKSEMRDSKGPRSLGMVILSIHAPFRRFSFCLSVTPHAVGHELLP